MKKNFTSLLVTALVIAGVSIASVASGQKTMYMDTTDNICTVGSTISIPLRTKNFDSILGIQGSIKWDTAVLKYSGISYSSSAIQLNASNVTLTNTSKGNMTFLWSDANLQPETVVDTTILFTLKFTVNKTIIGKTPVYFANSPTKLEIDISDFTGFPSKTLDTAFKATYVGFVSQATISKNGSILTAVSSGTPSGYQWNLNGSPIPSATSVSYANASMAGGSYSVTVNYANGCSSTSAPLLPVLLKQFTGYYKAGATNLSWVSASEVNAAYFVIQRSTNGKDFSLLKKVNATNNSFGASYTYADATNAGGKVYYRLQIVEKNGSVSYSNTVAITLNSALSFSVYPNPVKGNLTLQVQNSKTETVTVQVVDMLGKTIQKQQTQLTAGINNVSLNVTNLSKGSYIVLVKGETTQQQQFIKY